MVGSRSIFILGILPLLLAIGCADEPVGDGDGDGDGDSCTDDWCLDPPAESFQVSSVGNDINPGQDVGQNVRKAPPTDDSSKPAWCSARLEATSLVGGEGFTAILAHSAMANTLIVAGSLDCGIMERVTGALLADLARCSPLDACRADVAPEELATLKERLAKVPISVINVGDIEVEMMVGDGLAMAQWSPDVSFEMLAGNFSFEGVPEPSAGPLDDPGGPPSPPAPAVGPFRACIAVPCVVLSNCTGGGGTTRGPFARVIFDPTCDCPADAPSSCGDPAAADCACYEECCTNSLPRPAPSNGAGVP